MFKVLPVQDFSICLRCQYRLNLKPSLRTIRRRQIQASSSSVSRLRTFTSCSKARREDGQIAYTDDNTSSQSRVRYERVDERYYRSSREPPLKTALGVDSLGEPAEVLVMQKFPRAARNLGVIFTEEPLLPLPPSLEGTSEALLHGINAERGIADIEHVCTNIDCVRDTFLESRGDRGRDISLEDFDELVSRLLAGFEKKHLAEYWRRSLSTSTADALNLRYPYSSALFARSEWIPSTTSEQHAQAPPLMKKDDIQRGSTHGPLSLLDRGKQWHAENIIQRCWGLYREHVDGVGEVTLRLQQTYLELILNHGR